MIKTDSSDLHNCLKQIEDKLGWGNSSDWSSQNFKQLSEKVQEKTGITISPNTLKRLWGRISYNSKPSTVTLNTLVKFIDYENWSAFRARNSKGTIIRSKHTQSIFNWIKSKNRKNITLVSFVTVSILIAIIFSFSRTKINKDNFVFTSKKIAHGVPNSVMFEIDASSCSNTDKIEIQQNWDVSKRQIINKEDSLVTSVYYNPGYFDAKLVVNNQIVKQHGVLIPSNGWLALVETDDEPIYLKSSEFESEKGVSVNPELIKSYNLKGSIHNTILDYYWVKDFKDLKVDNFELETSVKNTGFQNYNGCQTSEIILYCEGEVILIPLSIKGCVADLSLQVLDKNINGNRNDLSNFGVEFSSWVNVKCVSQDDTLTIMVDGKVAYTAPFEKKNNHIYGIKYRFEGSGAVSKLKISNDKKVFLDI